MRKGMKRFICVVMAVMILVGGVFECDVYAKSSVSCKTLCSAVLKATGRSSKLKYASKSALDFGALSASDRSKVKNIQYVCDAKEVYSLCVMEAKSASNAQKLYNAMKKYKNNNCSSDYLSDYSASERMVFKNAVYGRKGKFVWYISMSAKKADNIKGQTALKKKL